MKRKELSKRSKIRRNITRRKQAHSKAGRQIINYFVKLQKPQPIHSPKATIRNTTGLTVVMVNNRYTQCYDMEDNQWFTEFTLKRIVLSHLDNFDIGTNINNTVTSADNIQASS